MTRSGERETLIGRAPELARIDALIASCHTQGAALVVLGDPGIGKSALLAEAKRRATRYGLCVLSAVGLESEAQLPFAALQQLLLPVLDRATDLPPVQRDALLSAFGIGEGVRPDPFLIAIAAVSLLATVAAECPVLLVADDVQWLDAQSHEALTFIARCATAHAIGVIGATRTGHLGPWLTSGFPCLEVGGVDAAAAFEILDECASGLSASDRDRIQAAAVGNPLALLELPTVWRSLDGATTESHSPMLSTRLERAFVGRVVELDPTARDALLVAAVDSVDTQAEILAATSILTGKEMRADVFDSAVAAGLLIVDEAVVSFRHPLVRSGVLQAETVARRQAANAAVAAVLVDEPYRRTWHRAQSIVGPDDEVADALEANVAIALGRGAVMSAIRDLERSAQLTRNSPQRGRRLLMAAEHAFGLGHADLVDRLVRAASRNDLSDLDRARMEWLREIFEGVPGDAIRVRELCDIAERASAAGDTDLALNLLLGAALRCWWGDTGPAARARVASVTKTLRAMRRDARYIAALAVAEPVLEGRSVYTLLSEAEAGLSEDGDDLRLLGMAAHAIGDEVRASEFLDRSEALLRSQGRLGLLPHVLSMQVAVRLELGDWRGAELAAEEGARIATETGQPIWSIGTLTCAARTSALAGATDRAFELAAEAELGANRRRLNDLLACVQLARGYAYLSDGDGAQAYEALRRLFDRTDPCFHHRERFTGVMYLAEAAVIAGCVEDARGVITDLEPVAIVTPSPILRTQLLYARAVLADDAVAEDLYRAALATDLDGWPWVEARVRLAYGCWLRRHGRRGAGPLLSSAIASFDSMGAQRWAAVARSALRPSAAGL